MKKKHLLLFLLYLISQNVQAQSPTKEWNKLGLKIVTSLNAHDASVDQYFDKMAFFNRFIAPNPSNKDLKKLNRTLREEWRSYSLGRSFAKQRIYYKYEYIGLHQDSSLVIRQWNENDGFNYLLFKLEYINDAWITVDIYVLMTGEFMSETMRNSVYMPKVIRLMQKGTEGRVGMSNFEIYSEAGLMMRNEDYQRAYTKISGIPLAERHKIHQLLKLNLSYYLDSNDKILKTIEEYQTLFPNDPSFEFIMLDKYVLEEEYDKALNAIDVINQFVGEDDYLHYQRGLMYQLLGDYQLGEKELRIAIKQAPNEVLYYWSLITILEWKEDDAGCVKVLKQIQRNFSYTKETLKEVVLETYEILPFTKKFEQWAK
jgi:tetratricopeptide (TPR) repeat protein